MRDSEAFGSPFLGRIRFRFRRRVVLWSFEFLGLSRLVFFERPNQLSLGAIGGGFLDRIGLNFHGSIKLALLEVSFRQRRGLMRLRAAKARPLVCSLRTIRRE